MSVSGTAMSRSRLWVVCAVALLMLALGFVRTLFDGMNRMFLFWTRTDVLLLAGLLAVETTLAWLAVMGLRRIAGGRLARWLSPLFFAWLVMVLVNLFPQGRQNLLPHFPWLTGPVYYLLAWGTGLALSVAAAWSSAGRRLAAAGWRALFHGWALLVVLPVNLWWISPSRPPASSSPAELPRRGGGASSPVVLVLLDMVADSEVVDEDGRVAEDLPNLKAFAETATYHSETRAPGLETLTSIPGICFQCAVGAPRLDREGVPSWAPAEGDGTWLGMNGFPLAIPRQVRSMGGRAVLCSYYLPWQDWFTGDWAWDAASTRCFYGIGADSGGWRGLAGRTGLILWQWTEASKSPLAAALKLLRAWEPGVNRHYAAMSAEIHAEGAAFLRNALSPGDFAFLHQPLPHPPFAVDGDGNVLRHHESTPTAYCAQLHRADTLFGEWMDALRASGLGDDAWVLVTSDHGLHSPAWSRNPARHDKPHVPLWIKAPGQRSADTDGTPVRLDRLADLANPPWPFGGGTP